MAARERIISQIVDLRVARQAAVRRWSAAPAWRRSNDAVKDITLAEYDRQIQELRRLLNSDPKGFDPERRAPKPPK